MEINTGLASFEQTKNLIKKNQNSTEKVEATSLSTTNTIRNLGLVERIFRPAPYNNSQIKYLAEIFWKIFLVIALAKTL